MNIKKIQKLIDNSDSILIGIGSSVYRSDKLPENHLDWNEIKKYNSVKCNRDKINNRIIDIFGDKNYFIITTCHDSNLSEIIPEERLFTPNGDCTKLQCYNACTDELWDIENYTDKQKDPLCPHCNSPLIMNITTDAYFVNNHLLAQENTYYSWINDNYNKGILLIEVEADENDKRQIRAPFENIATALQKTRLLRVNSGDISIPKSVISQDSLNISPEEFFKLL